VAASDRNRDNTPKPAVTPTPTEPVNTALDVRDLIYANTLEFAGRITNVLAGTNSSALD
jgi:hypothetical protein